MMQNDDRTSECKSGSMIGGEVAKFPRPEEELVAIEFLRRDIEDLRERADALDLGFVAIKLDEASHGCLRERPEPGSR